MPFVNTIERRGMLRLIEDSLRTKFGEEGIEVMPAIRELNDAEKYFALNRTILAAETLDEVRRACAKASAPTPRRVSCPPTYWGATPAARVPHFFVRQSAVSSVGTSWSGHHHSGLLASLYGCRKHVRSTSSRSRGIDAAPHLSR